MDTENISRFQLALESLGSVAITDAQGRYVWVSQQRLEKSGLAKEDMIGKYVHDIYPETLVDHVLKTGEPVMLHPIQGTDHSGYRQLFTNYYPLMENGKCLGCFLHVTMPDMKSAIEFTHTLEQLTQRLLEVKNEVWNQLSTTNYSSTNIIGRSPVILQLKAEISAAARTSSTVLIQGETGTGKELVAHAIHAASNRRNEAFVRVNCSAIPENLLESEFFGYESGAFTGASKNGKVGKFERASKGSLFLDEINTLPLSMQPKFLRVLQEHEVERIGGTKVIPINTRIIAASNSDLEKLVWSGAFREDLFYRLNVIKIEVPPLRERREDIPLLVNEFVERLNYRLGLDVHEVDPAVYELLLEHPWPGNVRQLQNAVERAMNSAYEGTLMTSHFKFLKLRQYQPLRSVTALESEPQASVSALELDQLKEALYVCNGNKKATAKRLGWSRSKLYRKMEKYGL